MRAPTSRSEGLSLPISRVSRLMLVSAMGRKRTSALRHLRLRSAQRKSPALQRSTGPFFVYRPKARDLLGDRADDARADGPAAFADREAQARVHGDRSDQLHAEADVVARHDHLRAFRQLNFAR